MAEGEQSILTVDVTVSPPTADTLRIELRLTSGTAIGMLTGLMYYMYTCTCVCVCVCVYPDKTHPLYVQYCTVYIACSYMYMYIILYSVCYIHVRMCI